MTYLIGFLKKDNSLQKKQIKVIPIKSAQKMRITNKASLYYGVMMYKE
jgi:hypothetical protein